MPEILNRKERKRYITYDDVDHDQLRLYVKQYSELMYGFSAFPHLQFNIH